MTRCYKSCKYNVMGVCQKYGEFIHKSVNAGHYGLLFHPLDYLNLYYKREENDVGHLMEIANKFLTDDASKNICRQYKEKGYISFKQRKLLVYKLLNCYEE